MRQIANFLCELGQLWTVKGLHCLNISEWGSKFFNLAIKSHVLGNDKVSKHNLVIPRSDKNFIEFFGTYAWVKHDLIVMKLGNN